LEGVKAVVTGSGGAMGAAVAVRFAEEGADIALNDRLPDLTGDTESSIRDLGRDAFTVVANVTRRDGAEALIGAALQRWGGVDVLVNVVGGIKGEVDNPVWAISEEDWEATMGINLRGTFHCTQLVLPSMMEAKRGKIVNIASVGWAGEAMHAHYAVAKAGVVAFTRSVATQVGPFNINVNAIAPGATRRRPGLIRDSGNDEGAPVPSVSSTGSLGRRNEPVDIANAALFLASEESRNISGQLLTVAGGNNPSL
jgi:NAD(P)-dependent dehydrogenase (short-subunit alcohol dehydrogenase family)